MADFSKFLNPAACFLGGLVSAFVCLMMPAATMAAGEEGHVRPVVARVLENVRKLRAADPEGVPMAFWDFDGTIIRGDFGVGYAEDGIVRYKGLIDGDLEGA